MRILFMTAALAILGCTSEALTPIDTTSASATTTETVDAGAQGADESTAACDGLVAGDACSYMTSDGTTVTATCKTCGDAGSLMCGAGAGRGH